MYYTDDPVADFLRYDAEQQAELDKLPVCCECDGHIQEEHCYEVNGEYICESCMESHRILVEDIAERW